MSTKCCAHEKQRPDGIDAVAIMTPNDTHFSDSPRPRSMPDWTWSATSRSPHDFQPRPAISWRARGRQARVFARRTRVFLLSDDALCTAASFMTARLVPSGWCRSNISRSAWRRASKSVTQNNRFAMDPRSTAQRTLAGHERHRLSRTAPGLLRRRASNVSRVAPMSPRFCRTARSSTTFPRCWNSTAERVARSPCTQAAAGGENDIRLRDLWRQRHARVVASRRKLPATRASG